MIEIERKFLVRHTDWGIPQSSTRIEQGYLFIAVDRTMRIRRKGDAYFLTLKVGGSGLSRHEIEMPVDEDKGKVMLDNLCVTPAIKKTRHNVAYAGKLWEIDVFDDVNQGLIVAEIELNQEDETFELPPWAGPEVSDDPRFFNSTLSAAPFNSWCVTYAQLVAEKSGQISR